MLGGTRIFYKQAPFSKVLVSRPVFKHCSTNTQTEGNVVIPPRIERGPTDILKALSSTVGIDSTAFPYKYPDDPFFYPHLNESKELIALSIESGRKSARWIFKHNPGFFKNQLSEPPIQEFFVKPVVIAESQPTENTLLNAIEERNVLKAIQVYEALEKENHDISESTKQSLLELTCFYNCEERPNLDLEEKWFFSESQENKVNYWKRNGFAQKLFEKMDSNSLVNSAIIQGMLKYDEIDLAHEIFEAAKVKKIKLSVGVYNMLCSTVIKKRSGEHIAKFFENILSEMSEEKIRPNLGTLNAILHSLLQSKNFEGKINFALKLMAEFERLGIEPSIGSYGAIFRILSYFPKEQNKCQNLCCDIMTCIEHEKFEILHPLDLDFFYHASISFSYHNDPDLSKRLIDMYSRNNNSKFTSSSFQELKFFNRLVPVIFARSTIDVTMDVYRRYFYTRFNPNQKAFEALVSAICENKTPEYLTEIWEDITHTQLFNRGSVLNIIMNGVEIFSDETSLKLFHSAAMSYLSFLESGKYRSDDPHSYSKILIAFVKNGDGTNILRLLKNLKSDPSISLNYNATEVLYYYALSEQKIPLLLESLRIAAATHHPKVSEMASKALPFLEDDSKTWATELLKKEKESKKEKKFK